MLRKINKLIYLPVCLLILQSKKIVDHAQLLAQGLFPVTSNADEVRMVTCVCVCMCLPLYMCEYTIYLEHFIVLCTLGNYS